MFAVTQHKKFFTLSPLRAERGQVLHRALRGATRGLRCAPSPERNS